MGDIVDVILSEDPGVHVVHHHGDPRRTGVFDRYRWTCRCGAESARLDMTVKESVRDFETHKALAEAKDAALSLREEREDYRKAVREKDAEIASLRADVERLLAEAARLREETVRLGRERDEWKNAEITLGKAYIRLREILGAWKTPHGSTPEQVWAHTEECARNVTVRVAALEAVCHRIVASFGREYDEVDDGSGRDDRASEKVCTYCGQGWDGACENAECELSILRALLSPAPAEPCGMCRGERMVPVGADVPGFAMPCPACRGGGA